MMPLLFLGVVFFFCLIGLGIGYVVQFQIFGGDIAWRYLRKVTPLFFLGVALAFALGYLGTRYTSSFPKMLEYVAFFCFVLWFVFLSYFATWPWRKKQAGSLLLDIGRLPNNKVFLILGLLEALISIMPTHSLITQALNGVFKSHTSWVMQIFLPIFAGWALAIFLLLLSFTKVEVRENGICIGFELIKWNKILSHQWEGKNGRVLTIQTKQISPLPFSINRSMPIPESKKEAVEQVLVQQASVNSSLAEETGM